MRKRILHLITISMLLALTTSLDAQWTIFDGTYTPNVSTPVWVKADVTEGVTDGPDPVLCTVVDDPVHTDNKWLRVEELVGNLVETWTMGWDQAASVTSTVIMRVKPTEDILTHVDTSSIGLRYAQLSLRNGNFKHEFQINSTGIIIKSGDENVIPVPDNNFHTYRVAIDNDAFNVYMDENETPILSGTGKKSSSDVFLLFGAKHPSGKHGGDYDWIIWDLSGAYAPGEGTPIPENLVKWPTAINDPIAYDELALRGYPNPFNSSTEVYYTVKEGSITQLDIFDVHGKHVKSLVNQYMPAGNHGITFEGSDLPVGIYLFKLRSGSLVATQKLMRY